MKKSKQKYSWRKGANNKVDAQSAGEELERIKSLNNDQLKPQTIVDASEPEDAVLHPAFEWRDEVAGNLYRNSQARNIVRSIRVIVPETKTTEPKYVHIKRVKENGYYEDARKTAADEDLFSIAMQELQRKIDSARRAAEELARLAADADHEGNQAILNICIEALSTANHAIDRLQ